MNHSHDEHPDLKQEQVLQQAISHHRAGQWTEAERLYRTVLQTSPQNPDANHNMGVLALQTQQHSTALPYLKRALDANPNQSQYWISYINALILNGHTDAARTVLSQGRQRGLHGKSVDVLERRLGGPSFEEKNMLVALFNQGRYTEEESLARKLIERFPDDAFAWKALGTALKPQGRSMEALEAERKAVELSPLDAEAHNNMGNTLQEYGRLSEAEACYRRAVEIEPNYAEAYANLGIVLNEQERPAEAESCYRRALTIKPDYTKALANLANSLHNLGRIEEAEICYRRVLEIRPDDFESALGFHLLMPIISESLESIASWRERYRAGLKALMDAPGSLVEDPGKRVNLLSFYLAYHNQDDRPIMEEQRRLFRARLQDLTFVSPHVPSWHLHGASGKRIRVGFISELLRNHTIGRLNRGFIRHLDRKRFEVVIIHMMKGIRDEFSHEIDRMADAVVTLPVHMKSQQQAVADLKLDVLYYTDIGMSPSTYFLAYARLAPVQATTLGHPDTTGLDTMDYFVSAASIEPEEADEYYTERLIRLNRIPCYYQPPTAPENPPTRVALGLPERGTLYGCPQTLFKIHPDFDAVLAAIAEGDPEGYIVLLAGNRPLWPELLKTRWAKSFPILTERVIFLPLMPLERFMALLGMIDVLLDPIHFGSGNSLYEAMLCGTPFVTWPGRFMRARIVAAAYRQMGIADAPVAGCLEDYAPLALALGHDPDRRQALREASVDAAGRELYADIQAVREFEAFLEAAVAAAARGEKLPMGWRPDLKQDISGRNRSGVRKKTTGRRKKTK